MNASVAYAVSNTELEIERTFNAPLARVWAAWTDPDQLSQWFGPAGTEVEDVSLALEVDGEFSIRMRSPSGEQHHVCGRYLRIEPQACLEFTWYWTSTPERESRVRVEFRAAGGGSRVKIHHDRFADNPTTQSHAQGWLSSLEQLEAALQRNA